MTQEQIEAKALELFPDQPWVRGSQQNVVKRAERAAFIKGCQYAATPSVVSREDAVVTLVKKYTDRKDDAMRSIAHKEISREYFVKLQRSILLYNRFMRDLTALLSSPAQPGYSDWISVKGRLPEPTLDVVLLIDHFCETKNYYEVTKWDGGQINSWRVTHWMPLPSPPTKSLNS